MDAAVLIACGQLLKLVHVAKLQIAMFIYLVLEAGKKAVLVEVIIYYLPAEINMHLIIKNKREGFWDNAFFA